MSHTHKQGFTLVELMLAMGFVSALLLAIAMTVIQISNIYTRGITFTNVNQQGGAIANELQKSISGVKAFSVSPVSLDPNTKFIDNPESGRLCTGKYSYVWIYGKYLQPPYTPGNYIKYQGFTAASSPKILFVKVYDPSFSVCIQSGLPLKYPDIIKANAVELLNAGQFDLAIHGFKIVSYVSDGTTGQSLYSIEFYIGTNDISAFVDPNFPKGILPVCVQSGIKANPFYCSVSQFNVLARSGSATNDSN